MLPNDWYASSWVTPVVIVWLVVAILVSISYYRLNIPRRWKVILAGIKVVGFALIGLCLLEPVVETEVPQKGKNVVVVMADNSSSMLIKDKGTARSRFEQMLENAQPDSPWLNQLDEQFDLRLYSFDKDLERLNSFAELSTPKPGTDVGNALSIIANRYRDKPLAGVVLLTDGIGNGATTADKFLKDGPPIFPVQIGSNRPWRDLAIEQAICSETNFESAPVEITAEMKTVGFQGTDVSVVLLDQLGGELDRKIVANVEDGKLFSVRFKVKPKERGVRVFRVEAFSKKLMDRPEEEKEKSEATLKNNRRTVVVNRGKGPFRILYVSGRPNWEYKYLRRALANDHELDLVGLMRLARKKPKFAFRKWESSRKNDFFRGFDDEEELQEQYDEPVLVRLQTRDSEELAGGFPVDEESLFEFDALVIDDLEAKFFTEEQKENIKKFVTERGGGLMMLGGGESFGNGGFDRSPIADVLPVYLSELSDLDPSDKIRVDYTREGWVQPWVRLKATRLEEEQRVSEMPGFRTINLVNSFKPGASVLLTAEVGEKEYPALVTQNYGAGRTAAVLIGDLWRWQMAMKAEKDPDLSKLWRQMIRWLTADVPRRIEVFIERENTGQHTLSVEVRDQRYQPTDDGTLEMTVVTPAGESVPITARAVPEKTGRYEANYLSSQEGAYRLVAKVNFDDEIFDTESGWVSEPEADEFEDLQTNETMLQQLADQSGGKVLKVNSLSSLPRELESRPAEFMTTKVEPWWHRWSIFAFAIVLFVGEWTLRRWKGLA